MNEIDEAKLRHPSARVGTLHDGSQVLLEVHDDGRVTIAVRPDRWARWGEPVDLEDE